MGYAGECLPKKVDFKVWYNVKLQSVGLTKLPSARFYILSDVIAAVYNASDGQVYYDVNRQTFTGTIAYSDLASFVNSIIAEVFYKKIISNPSADEYLVSVEDIDINAIKNERAKIEREKMVADLTDKLIDSVYRQYSNVYKTFEVKQLLSEKIRKVAKELCDAPERAEEEARKIAENLKEVDREKYIAKLEKQIAELEKALSEARDEIHRLRKEQEEEGEEE